MHTYVHVYLIYPNPIPITNPNPNLNPNPYPNPNRNEFPTLPPNSPKVNPNPNYNPRTIDYLLDTLSLTHVKNSQIGSAKKRGISGGERRRLSLARELLGNPKILIADEPTTGLDSYQAQHVVRLLKRVAVQKNIPVTVTLHQPRSSVWNMLDDVLILTPNGKPAYHGTKDGALKYFSRLGYRCPVFMNPSEYLIDIVSADLENPSKKIEGLHRIETLEKEFAKFSKKQRKSTIPAETSLRKKNVDILAAPEKEKTPWASDKPLAKNSLIYVNPHKQNPLFSRISSSFGRIGCLFRRAITQNCRDWSVLATRVLAYGGLAKVYTSVLRANCPADSVGSLPDKICLLTFGTISMAQLSLIKSLMLFATERSTVERERARGQYSALEYVISKLVAELPVDTFFGLLYAYVLHANSEFNMPRGKFLSVFALLSGLGTTLGLAVGAAVPSGEAALVTGPVLMVVFTALGIINPSGARPPASGDSENSGKNPKDSQTEAERKKKDKKMYSPTGLATCPVILRPFKLCSPIKWGIEAILCSEFRSLKLKRDLREAPRMGALALVSSGDMALEALGLGDQTTGNCLNAMGRILVGQIAFSVAAMSATRPKFADLGTQFLNETRELEKWELESAKHKLSM
ncbi:hypothetical protein AAMO2058_000759500 [Amorphochlora amoebiformis]